MSTGGVLGGIAGGIVGFFIGGPIGALWGASIGFGVGMAVDPIQPDMPTPGQMAMDVQVTTAKYGDPIYDILGTVELTGNIIWYCCDYTVEETEEAEGAKGGGPSQTVVTGVKYYLSWAMAICMGPVDTLYTIRKDDEVVWEGELDRPVSGGERSIYIEALETTIIFFYGTDDQDAPAALCRHLEAGNITGGPGSPVGSGACDDDANLNIPYRGLCWVYVPDAYIGGYNRAPTLKFVVKKRPTITDSEAHDIPYGNIGPFDYNPAHAVWYIQETLAGLPKTFMDSDSFEAAALTLHTEQRGLSILFAQRQSALTYIESVNAHADMIERFDIDGSLHLKLIRAGESISSLPIINTNTLVEDPVINRPSWLGANTEVKVVFSERNFACEEGTATLANDPATPSSIGKSETISLYVDGGCPSFEWEIITEDFGCTLGESETFTGENTLTSGECTADTILIRVTDSLGNTVDISITGIGSDLAFDDASTPDSVTANTCIDLYITGGGPPFEWVITAGQANASLAYDETNVRENELCADECVGDQINIKVADNCAVEVDFSIAGVGVPFSFDDDSTPDTIDPNDSISVFVIGGIAPFTWGVASAGYSFGQLTTAGRSNVLTCAAVDYECSASIVITDACGDSVSAIIRNTDGQWVLVGIGSRSVPGGWCGSLGGVCTQSRDIVSGYQKWKLMTASWWCSDGGGRPPCTFSWTVVSGNPVEPTCGDPLQCGTTGGSCGDGQLVCPIDSYRYYTWQCP